MDRFDTDRARRVERLFEAACELEPAERERHLAHECEDDPALLEEIRSLLAADGEAGGFLSATTPGLGFGAPEGLESPDETLLGQRLGPYRLESVIGAGGMGTVFLATRQDGQYDKRVAIKVIKRGMETRSVLRRFHTERQALAHLEHPNIARLLDGGVTDDGRPYLVMEHVDGELIDAFCDSRRLPIAKRLELFLDVCDAVQYAHGKLIVHRDIKPGNVLVTSDGVPKLLDFGLARILDREAGAGAPTMMTQRFLTPDYASPEQVSGAPVTTASDVYSLGVMMYELLTGHRPYRFISSSPQEIERVLCREEPSRPSVVVRRTVKVSSRRGLVSLTPESVSRTREGRPDRLRRRLEGDLDTIVLMVLRKEPELRYASVDQLAEDVRRHLDGRPVLARKPTLRYRAAKLLRRRKGAALAAALIVAALLAGALGITREARRARAEEQKMRLVLSSLDELFRGFDPRQVDAAEVSVLGVLDREAERVVADLAGVPEAQLMLAERIADIYGGFAAVERSIRWRERVLAMKRAFYGMGDLRVADTLHDLANELRAAAAGRAESLFREALDIRQRHLGVTHADVAETMAALARVVRRDGRHDEGGSLLIRALEVRRALGSDRELARALLELSGYYHGISDYKRAVALVHEARAIAEEKLPPEQAAWFLHRGGGILHDRGRYDEAEPYYRGAFEAERARYGANSRPAARAGVALALLLKDKGEYDEAERLCREGLRIFSEDEGKINPTHLGEAWLTLAKVLSDRGDLEQAENAIREALSYGTDDMERARHLSMLARTLVERERYAQAEPVARKSLQLHHETFPPYDWNLHKTASILGAALAGLNRFEEAEPLLLEAYPIIRDDRGPDHPRTRQALERIVFLYEHWYRPDDAARYRDLLRQAGASPSGRKAR